MSFILDALRKSEHERQRQTGPALVEVAVAAPKPKPNRWAGAAIALLVVNLVAIGPDYDDAPITAQAVQAMFGMAQYRTHGEIEIEVTPLTVPEHTDPGLFDLFLLQSDGTTGDKHPVLVANKTVDICKSGVVDLRHLRASLHS